MDTFQSEIHRHSACCVQNPNVWFIHRTKRIAMAYFPMYYVQNSLLAMGTETSAMALLQYPDFVASTYILNVA